MPNPKYMQLIIISYDNFPPVDLLQIFNTLKYEPRGNVIISFDPSAPNRVEEITVKLHLTGKSRLTF